MTILVSVVVPTYLRPELLDRCLQALMAQDMDPSLYEILVVDDAADESTRRLVSDWVERSRTYALETGEVEGLSVISTGSSAGVHSSQVQQKNRFVQITGIPRLYYLPMLDKHGPAAARNCGWRRAAGEMIAFTDDDCIPSSGWLREGLAAFSRGVAGVSGKVIVPLSARPTDYERDATGLERSRFVTANCFYRREVLQAVGGFDERFPMAWREDSDLFFSLLERGYLLVDAPRAVVVHPVRSAPWGVSLAQQRKSQYNALLYKKHPRLYRQWIQPSPPWDYYGIVVFLLFAVVAGAARWGQAALISMLGWSCLTLQFFFRRVLRNDHNLNHMIEMGITSTLIPLLAVYWRLRGAFKFRVFFL